MTPVFLDSGSIRERVKRMIARDPAKSISGLAEALGVPKNRSRQWKSKTVKRVFNQIEESFRSIQEVSGYLGSTSEELLCQEATAAKLRDKDEPHPLSSGFKNFGVRDQQLVRGLVRRLSTQ